MILIVKFSKVFAFARAWTCSSASPSSMICSNRSWSALVKSVPKRVEDIDHLVERDGFDLVTELMHVPVVEPVAPEGLLELRLRALPLVVDVDDPVGVAPGEPCLRREQLIALEEGVRLIMPGGPLDGRRGLFAFLELDAHGGDAQPNSTLCASGSASP
ncbi:MAG: hypothetical protein CMN31_08625 [Sandaracinus sp.]|nr:hypothetical protein [Sandaracinus sp.]MBJ71394.1 hypothetical protein [Sandaracinus sp.]